MMSRGIDAPRIVGVSPGLLVVLGLALCIGACEQPRPRSFTEYMEDPVARDGTLARCNQDRGASDQDPECINARRAAASAAARQEARRRADLESESERKRAAMRDQIAAEQAAAERAEASALAAAEAAYEAQWQHPEGQLAGPVEPDSAPAPQRVPTATPAVQPAPRDPQTVAREANPELSTLDPNDYIPQPAITPQPKLEELTIPRPFRRLPEPTEQ